MSLLDWNKVECVFLDMDGTLLDLNYDNHVWNNLFPAAYAKIKGISTTQAQEFLLDHMRKIHGTIEFYSFEYWAEFTGVDIVGTHQQATQLLGYRPGAHAFLQWLRLKGLKTVIATNAHRDSITVKDAHTDISSRVDAVVSSHDFSAPKEADAFWRALFAAHPHNPNHCVFIDDNEPVLDAAQRCGVGHLYAVDTPDSQRPRRSDLRYPSFNHFAEICPAVSATHV